MKGILEALFGGSSESTSVHDGPQSGNSRFHSPFCIELEVEFHGVLSAVTSAFIPLCSCPNISR